MVQPEIQATQDAALSAQKLCLGEGAGAQEAEGGGLGVGGKEVLLLTALEHLGSVLSWFWSSVFWSVKWGH